MDGLAHYERNIRPGSIGWQMLRKKAAFLSVSVLGIIENVHFLDAI